MSDKTLDLSSAIQDALRKEKLRRVALVILSAKKDLLYEDTGNYDEEHEKHLREELKLWADYAEDGPTFDPEGKYLCESCDMRKAPDQCIRVEGPIKFEEGGCRIYVFGEEPETGDMPRKLTQIQAMYSERPQSKAFGCSRCEYSAEAKKKDSDGRPSWCRFWGLHIVPSACCMMNDAVDDVFAPGDKN